MICALGNCFHLLKIAKNPSDYCHLLRLVRGFDDAVSCPLELCLNKNKKRQNEQTTLQTELNWNRVQKKKTAKLPGENPSSRYSPPLLNEPIRRLASIGLARISSCDESNIKLLSESETGVPAWLCRALLANCSSRNFRRIVACSSCSRRRSFSCTACLNFSQNVWNILKHSSNLNVFGSSQKNSANCNRSASTSFMPRCSICTLFSAACKKSDIWYFKSDSVVGKSIWRFIFVMRASSALISLVICSDVVLK